MTLAHVGFSKAQGAVPWLPVRVPPLLGESFESLCGRLAASNDVRKQDLVQFFRAKTPTTRTQIEAVAEAIGMEPAQVEFLTLAAVDRAVRRSRSGWRLQTTVWVCPHEQCCGVEDVLRGLAMQFLCLRCNRFLVPRESATMVGERADDALVQVQWEILDSMAVKSNEQIKQRLSRLRRCAVSIARVLLQTEFRSLAKTGKQGQGLPCYRVVDRWEESALGIPEIPELVGATLRSAWEISASSHATYLAVNALGDKQLPDYKKWEMYSHTPSSTLRDALPGDEMTADSVIATGTRIRQLVRDFGLSPEHVPTELRYSTDPMVLTEQVWRWRRHVCTQLRLWLMNIEIADTAIASHRGGRPTSDAVLVRQKELEVSWEWYELIVPFVADSDAAGFLAQMMELAERVARLNPEERGDPRAHLGERTFRDLAPSAARRGDATVARYWMWLDDIVGQDQYGYLPPCRPSMVAAFDRALRPEERLALRLHSRKQKELPDYLFANSDGGTVDFWPADSA